MARQQVIWTALPNGIVQVGSTRQLRLSVFVSPRLQPDGATGVLAPFDFLDWPARLQPSRVVFDVVVDDGTRVRADRISPPPDSALWRALFDQQTVVRRQDPAPPAEGLGHTYHVSPILSTLKAGYQRIAAEAPHSAPSAQTVQGAFPGLAQALRPLPDAVRRDRAPAVFDLATAGRPQLVERHAYLADTLLRLDEPTNLAERIAAAVATARRIAAVGTPRIFTEVVPDTGSPASQFAQLVAFHHPAATGVADESNQVDFHQMITALCEYPELLRRLGLVIDLVIDLQVHPTALPASSSDHPRGLQVIPTFTPPLTPPAADNAPPYTPITRYVLDLHGDQSPLPVFAPAARSPGSGEAEPEIVLGLLNLHLPSATNPLARQFEIVQVDVDGAAFKTLNMLSTLARNSQQPAPSIGAASESSPPSLRTSGLSIVRANHAEALQQGINTASALSKALQGQEQAEVFAEDLVRGYRVDVFDSASQQWHSLHHRVGTYTFPRAEGGPRTLPPIADEGFVQPGLTQAATADDASPLPRVHESLFHWQGWSLSVARPGTPIETSRPAPPPADGQPAGGLQLDVAGVAAPRSLPRLRFGLDYQLRVRVVDLAGNSLSLDEATEVLKALDARGRPSPALPGHIGDFTYRRFEPISAPVLVLREELTEGESPERLVIRSNHDVSADAYAAGLGDPKYLRANERHVAPPKTSQHMVETHGLLDAAFGTGVGFQRTYTIASKEKGSFNDTSILDIETGQLMPIPDTVLVNPRTGERSTIPHSVRFVQIQTGDGHSHGYPVHYEPQLRLPYLPDPLARGAALFGLPGMPLGTTGRLNPSGQIEFVQTTLPQAAIAALGLVTQIDFGPGWPERLPFRLQVREGSERPSWDPAARVLTVQLPKAETATIRLSAYPLETDLPLLGVRDWMLEWLRTQPGTPTLAAALQTATAGALPLLSPTRELVLVHAVQQPLKVPQLTLISPAPRDPHATFAYLGGNVQVDGKSTAKLDLLATWDEPVDGPEDAPRRTVTAHVFEVPLHLDGESVRPDADPVPIASYDPPADRVQLLAPSSPGESQRRRFLSRHEFDDTRYREVTYRVVATTRFREYFPATLTSDARQISRTSTEVKVKVPSSAAPAPPQVLYVLPTFRWTRPNNPLALRQDRVRHGGGLRVFIGRPWYSSGADEQLGVVLAMQSAVQADLTKTLWGGDPIFGGSGSTTDPLSPGTAFEPSPFKNGKRVQVGLQVVFAHAVHFDAERGLWYSDIEVDVGQAYVPFVRLALARYQPNAIPGAELSTVVLADIVQLAPDRTVSLISDAANRDRQLITVAGVTYSDIATPSVPNRPPIAAVVEVSLEQRTVPGTQDEFGWTPVASALQPRSDPQPPVAPLLWSGQVTLPSPRAPNQFRLVVKEFEQLPTDTTPPLTLIKRLVFADTIVL
jgi:hypothetical protein